MELRIWCLLAAFCIGIISAATPSRRDALNIQRQQRLSRRTFSAEEIGDYDQPTNSEPEAKDETTPEPRSYSRRVDGVSNIDRIRSRTGRARTSDPAYDTLQKFERSQLNTNERKAESSDAPSSYAEVRNPNTRTRGRGNVRTSSYRKKTVEPIVADVTAPETAPVIVENRRASIFNTRSRSRQTTRSTSTTTTVEPETSSPNIDESKIEVINSNLEDITRMTFEDVTPTVSKSTKEGASLPSAEDFANSLTPSSPQAPVVSETTSITTRKRVRLLTNRRNLQVKESDQTTQALQVSSEKSLEASTKSSKEVEASGPSEVPRNSRRLRFKQRQDGFSSNAAEENVSGNKNPVSFSETIRNPDKTGQRESNENGVSQRRRSFGRRFQAPVTSTEHSVTSTETSNVSKRVPSRRRTNFRPTQTSKTSDSNSEIDAEDNYPASFKALLQAKTATPSNNAESEELATRGSQKVQNLFVPSAVDDSSNAIPASTPKFKRRRIFKSPAVASNRSDKEDLSGNADIDAKPSLPTTSYPALKDFKRRPSYSSKLRKITTLNETTTPTIDSATTVKPKYKFTRKPKSFTPKSDERKEIQKESDESDQKPITKIKFQRPSIARSNFFARPKTTSTEKTVALENVDSSVTLMDINTATPIIDTSAQADTNTVENVDVAFNAQDGFEKESKLSKYHSRYKSNSGLNNIVLPPRKSFTVTKSSAETAKTFNRNLYRGRSATSPLPADDEKVLVINNEDGEGNNLSTSTEAIPNRIPPGPFNTDRRFSARYRAPAGQLRPYQATVPPLPSTAADLGEDNEINTDPNIMSYSETRSTLSSDDLKLSESVWTPAHTPLVETSHYSPSATISIFEALADILTSTPKPTTLKTDIGVSNPVTSAATKPVQSEMQTESTVGVTNDVTTTTPRSRAPFATLLLYSTTYAPPPTTDSLTTHTSEAPSSTDTLSTVFNTKSISDLILSLNTNVSSELTSMLSNNIRDIMLNMDDGLRSKVTVDMDEIFKSMTTTPLTPSSEFDSTIFTSTPAVFTDVTPITVTLPGSIASIVDSTVTEIPLETTISQTDYTTAPSIGVSISTVASFIMNYDSDSSTQETVLTQTPSTLEIGTSTQTSAKEVTVVTPEQGLTTEEISSPKIEALITTTATPLILSIDSSLLSNDKAQSTEADVSALDNSPLDNSQIENPTVVDQIESVMPMLSPVESNLNARQGRVQTVVDTVVEDFLTNTGSPSSNTSQVQTVNSSQSPLFALLQSFSSTKNDLKVNDPCIISPAELWGLSRRAKLLRIIEEIIKRNNIESMTTPSPSVISDNMTNRQAKQLLNPETTAITVPDDSASTLAREEITSVPVVVSSEASTMTSTTVSFNTDESTDSTTSIIPTTFVMTDDVITTDNTDLTTVSTNQQITITTETSTATGNAISVNPNFESTTLMTTNDVNTPSKIQFLDDNLSLSTDKPSTTTTQASTTVLNSSTDSDFNEKLVTTEQIIALTENMITTTDIPIATAESSATTDNSTARKRLLETTTDIPTTTERLQTTTDDSATRELLLETTTHVPTTTERLSKTTTDVPTTTERLSKTTTDVPTTSKLLLETTTDVPTTKSLQIIEKNVTPAPQTILTTTPTYSWVPPFPTAWRNSLEVTASPRPVKKDYFVFGILPNNTVVRKNPNDDALETLTEASPYIIFGVLPNNTIVRKFPNGTRVPRLMQKIEVLPIDPRSLRNPLHPIYRTPALIKPNSNPIQEITTNDITLQTNSTEILNRAAIKAQLFSGGNVNNTQQMISSSFALNINTNDQNKNDNTVSSETTVTTEKAMETTSNVLSLLTTAKSAQVGSVNEILLNSIALATKEEENKVSMVSTTREPRILTLDIDPETKRIRTEKPTEENGSAVFKFIPINNDIQVDDKSSNVFKLDKPTAVMDVVTAAYTSTSAPSLNTENIIMSTTKIEELSTTIASLPTTESTTHTPTTTGSVTTTTMVPTTSTTTTETTTTEFIPPPTTTSKRVSFRTTTIPTDEITMTSTFERPTTTNTLQTFSSRRKTTTTTEDLATTSTLISMATNNLVAMTTDSPVTFQSRRVAARKKGVTTNKPSTSTYSVADDIAFLKSLKMYVNPDDADDEASLANRIIALAVERSLSELQTPNKTIEDRTPKRINGNVVGNQIPVTKHTTTTTTTTTTPRTTTTTENTQSIDDDIKQYEADTKLLQALLSATGKSPANFDLSSLINAQLDKSLTTTTPTTTTKKIITIPASIEDDIKQYERDAKLLQALLKATGQSTAGLNIPSLGGFNTLADTRKPIITTTTSTTTPRTTRRTTHTVEMIKSAGTIEDELRQYEEDTRLLQALLKATGQSTTGLNIPSLAGLNSLANTREPISTTTTTSTTPKTTTARRTTTRRTPPTTTATGEPTVSIDNDIRQYEEDTKLLRALLKATGQSTGGLNIPSLAELNSLTNSRKPITTTTTTSTTPKTSTARRTTTRKTSPITTVTSEPTVSIDNDIRQFQEDAKLLQALLSATRTGQSPSNVNTNSGSRPLKVPKNVQVDLKLLENLLASPSPLDTDEVNDEYLKQLAKRGRRPSRVTIDSKPDNSDSQLRVKPLDRTTTQRTATGTRTTTEITTLKALISDDLKNFEEDKKLLQTLLKLQSTGGHKLPGNNKVAVTGFTGDETLAALLAQEEKEKPVTKSSMPLSTEFGKSNDALLAALFKEQGYGPTTPGSLDEQLKFAALLNQVVVTPKARLRTTTTTPPPPPPPPRAARPLLDGLSWLWNQWQETAPVGVGTAPANARRPRPAPSGGGGAGSWFGSGPFVGNADDTPAPSRPTNGNRILLQPPRSAGTAAAGAPARPQLVSAAINVTRAFSQFLGAAIQGAAATVQNVIKAGQKAATDVYSSGSG